jgi:hypothetical protein
MFACHRAVRNVGGRDGTEAGFDPTTPPKKSGKTRQITAIPA